jgi:hypothetical protein
MRLRLADFEQHELPHGTALAGTFRRPGDMHDVISIPEGTRNQIERKADASSVPSALATALLLELVLLERDISTAAVRMPVAPEPVVNLRLTAAQAHYLRGLTWHRPGFVPFADGTAALPVRLLARSTLETLGDAARGDLELALRWESAAVAAGRWMAELGLLSALTRAGAA